MADHFYGASIGTGADASGVSTGTSTTSKNVEVRVHDGVTGMNKFEVLKLIEVIAEYIEKNNAPA